MLGLGAIARAVSVVCSTVSDKFQFVACLSYGLMLVRDKLKFVGHRNFSGLFCIVLARYLPITSERFRSYGAWERFYSAISINISSLRDGLTETHLLTETPLRDRAVGHAQQVAEARIGAQRFQMRVDADKGKPNRVFAFGLGQPVESIVFFTQ